MLADVDLQQGLEAGKAQDAHQGGVGVQHPAVRRGAVQAHGHAFEEAVVALLRRLDRGFGPLAVRDVAGEGAVVLALLVAQAAQGDLAGEDLAPVAHVGHLEGLGPLLAGLLRHGREEVRVPRGEAFGHRHPQELLAGVAHEDAGCFVDVEEAAFGVGPEGTLAGAVEEETGEAQGLLGLQRSPRLSGIILQQKRAHRGDSPLPPCRQCVELKDYSLSRLRLSQVKAAV